MVLVGEAPLHVSCNVGKHRSVIELSGLKNLVLTVPRWPTVYHGVKCWAFARVECTFSTVLLWERLGSRWSAGWTGRINPSVFHSRDTSWVRLWRVILAVGTTDNAANRKNFWSAEERVNYSVKMPSTISDITRVSIVLAVRRGNPTVATWLPVRGPGNRWIR